MPECRQEDVMRKLAAAAGELRATPVDWNTVRANAWEG
jgi:hypothetical protein